MPYPELRGGKTPKQTRRRKRVTRKKRVKNFRSACTNITEEEKCRYPCSKRYSSSENNKKFKSCATKFSAKHDYMDLTTKRRVRAVLTDLKKSAKKINQKHSKARKSARKAIQESRKADKDSEDVEKEQGTFNGLFNSISDTLGINSSNKVEAPEAEAEPEAPEADEPEAEPEAEAEVPPSEPEAPEADAPEAEVPTSEAEVPASESESEALTDSQPPSETEVSNPEEEKKDEDSNPSTTEEEEKKEEP